MVFTKEDVVAAVDELTEDDRLVVRALLAQNKRYASKVREVACMLDTLGDDEGKAILDDKDKKEEMVDPIAEQWVLWSVRTMLP